MFQKLVTAFGLNRTVKLYSPKAIRGPVVKDMTDAEKAVFVASMKCAPHVQEALGEDGTRLLDAVRSLTELRVSAGCCCCCCCCRVFLS